MGFLFSSKILIGHKILIYFRVILIVYVFQLFVKCFMINDTNENHRLSKNKHFDFKLDLY